MNLLELQARLEIVNRILDTNCRINQADTEIVLVWCNTYKFPVEVLFGPRPAFAKEIARRVIQLLVTATALKQIDLPLDPA